MPTIRDKLAKIKRKKKRQEPLWKGPEVSGITQSALEGFIECRERFRLRMVEGSRGEDKFSSPLEFGSLWHVAEEWWSKERSMSAVETGLIRYAKQLCKRYPHDQEQIKKWYEICRMQFPIYRKYWESHEEKEKRKPLFEEQVFSVLLTLPSGRVVLMRGKFDGGSLINGKFFLDEHKTKGSEGTHGGRAA